MDKHLLDLLVCPVCKGPLRLVQAQGEGELVCRADRIAYAIRDGIPVMLPDDARTLATDDPLLQR